MKEPSKYISITVIYEDEDHQLTTYPNEYRNLMMLIYDRLGPDEFGDCLGMGRCGTCLIEVHDTQYPLSSYQRNEETTLSKAQLGDKVRLACQILIDEHIEGLVVKVINPNQSLT